MNRGQLIVVCGTEGSGKTTAIKRLMQSDLADQFVATREPGGSPNAEKVREFVLSEVGGGFNTEARFYLMWAARMIHLQETIIPALESGKHVICDRFDCCTWAFQIWAEDNHRLIPLFQHMRMEMLERFFKDSRWLGYIHFDLPPAVGLARKAGVDEDRNYFDEKKLDFHERVRAGYAEFNRYFVGFNRINANQSAEAVWNAFREEIEKNLE